MLPWLSHIYILNPQTIKIQLGEGEQFEENVQLGTVGTAAREVVVAAHASGQNAAMMISG